MKKIFILILSGLFILAGCNRPADNHEAVIPSPGFDTKLYFNLYDGYPYYLVYNRGIKLLNWSLLGFRPGQGLSLTENLEYRKPEGPGRPDTEEQGFFSEVTYNELSVGLCSATEKDRGYIVDFRVFRDGFAYRYRFDGYLPVEDLPESEFTQFNLNNEGLFRVTSVQRDSLTVENGDSLQVEVISKDGQALQFLEVGGDESQPLRVRQGDQPYSVMLGSTGDGSVAGDRDLKATKWRVIIITNNQSDESY